MSKVKFYREEQIPLEMHKVRVVQKLTLLPVEERLKEIGYWQEDLAKKFREDFGESL